MNSHRRHRLRRLTVVAAALMALPLVLPVPGAQADFGLNGVGVAFTGGDGTAAMGAGTHPYAFTTNLGVNTRPTPEGAVPDGAVKDVRINFPPGLVGTPDPVPPCSAADFANSGAGHSFSACPASSAIGVVQIAAGFGPRLPGEQLESVPVFNLEAPPGVASKIGFIVDNQPTVIETRVNPEPPYNLVSTVTNIPNFVYFFRSDITLWGVPADPAHDGERGECAVGEGGGASCPVSLPQVPFFTLPTACTGPLQTRFEADPWGRPGAWTAPIVTETDDGAEPPNPLGITGCEGVQFKPTTDAAPTTASADSPSGLDYAIDIADPGLTNPTGSAQSTIKKAVVTLPPGMTANPALASGLVGCGEADERRETVDSEPGDGCPQASKIGEVEVETPLLPGTLLRGQVFVATPFQNPFDSLLAIYMVIREPKLGILVKLPGRISPDPQTGRLVTTFGEPGYEIPQFPFSHFRFHFNGGPRAPLTTPQGCGTYQVKTEFTPWSDPGSTYSSLSEFAIDSGAGGGACPAGEGPLDPQLEAGTLAPVAGAYSPFVLRLTRADGTARLRSIEASLPEGLLAKLAGVTECPDAQIAAAAARSRPGEGALERSAPSCPASSEVGVVDVGAGAGSPTYAQGHAYLAGPYEGAPLSLAVVTPAIAGPFDLGSVVVRNALYVDPLTARVRAVSDPLPSILQGIPLDIRSISVDLGRSAFTLNPTSCEPMQVGAAAGSLLGQTTSLLNRFQVGGCAGLDFKPALNLRLKGATRKTAHPALRAVLTPKPGEANIGRAQVNLPPGEFLDQGNLNKTCTRPVLLAGACPKSTVYGHAKAWTPLLDKPLQGPVYLVGGFGFKLPALVAELDGQIRVLLVGKVDSGKNRGIRNTFETVPDAPVSRFVLELKGGKKYGLLQNSENLCKAKKSRRRAIVRFTGQNGKVEQFKPVVANECGKGKKHKKKARHHKPHGKRGGGRGNHGRK